MTGNFCKQKCLVALKRSILKALTTEIRKALNLKELGTGIFTAFMVYIKKTLTIEVLNMLTKFARLESQGNR